jgi:hypothetical protein
MPENCRSAARFDGEMELTLEAPVMSNHVVAAGIQDDFHVL